MFSFYIKILTRPAAANVNFPFHMRTCQVSSEKYVTSCTVVDIQLLYGFSIKSARTLTRDSVTAKNEKDFYCIF